MNFHISTSSVCICCVVQHAIHKCISFQMNLMVVRISIMKLHWQKDCYFLWLIQFLEHDIGLFKHIINLITKNILKEKFNVLLFHSKIPLASSIVTENYDQYHSKNIMLNHQLLYYFYQNLYLYQISKTSLRIQN